MDFVAGIVWDPREPIPPEVLQDFHFHEPQRHYHGPHPREQDRLHRQNLNDFHPVPDFVENFVVREPERNILPPLSISLHAEVIQDTAKVTVTQLFWNDSDSAISKGSYSFPLPAGCTVTDFCCRIGRQRVIRAKVKPKEAARDAFHRAVRNNQTAGLLQQATPEVFTTVLGNIPKHTKLRAEISFVSLLKYGFFDGSSTTTLTIPTYIAARYGNLPPEIQGVELNPAGITQRLAVEVEVTSAEKVRSIKSKTHSITVKRRGVATEYDDWEAFVAGAGDNNVQTAWVKLTDGSTFLNKDFVLEIVNEPRWGEESPQAWIESHPSLQDHKALMLTIPPKFTLKNACAEDGGEIIFVVDRSGSMSDKIESLKSAMEFFLKSISQGQRFNIWCFGSRHTSLWSNSQQYQQHTLDAALDFVQWRFRADMGGTELLPALEAVMKARDPTRMNDIIVLTDGQVWRLDETIDFVQQTKRDTEGRVRVFALGIGDAVSHELVEGLAKAGGGYAEVIPSASQGGWEGRLVAMLGAAVVGHIGPIQIELGPGFEEAALQAPELYGNHNPGMDDSRRPPIMKSPADASALSPFLRNRVYMLFNARVLASSLEHVTIKINAPDGTETATQVPVKSVAHTGVIFHKLGARALLGDLERSQSWIQSHTDRPARHSAQEQELTRSEGESLGCKWSLVSKWTSFYAVEEPYQANENELDPVLDMVDFQIHHGPGQMGLLRPRGAALPGDWNVSVPAVEQRLGLESDEDAETPSESDLEHHDGGHSESGDDSNGDDNNSDGGDGGAAGGHLDGDEETQPRPPDRQNDRRGEEHDQGNEPQNRPGNHSRRFENANAATTSRNAKVQTPINEDPPHTISYNIKEAPDYKYPRFGGPPLPSAASQHTYDLSKRTKRSFSYLDDSHSSDAESFKEDTESLKYKKAKSLLKSSETSALTSGYRFSRPRHSRESTLPSTERSAASVASPPSLLHVRSPTPASGNLLHPGLEGWGSFGNSRGSFEKSRQSYVDSLEDVSSPPLSDFLRSNDVSSTTPTETGDPRRGGNALDASNNAIPANDTTSAIMAPSHNLPAASAMISTKGPAVKSEEERRLEQIVRRLVNYQKFDGRFEFPQLEVLSSILGGKFLTVVDDVGKMLRSGLSGSRLIEDMAVTISIVVLFELKLQFCKSLWSMIDSKARRWIDDQGGILSRASKAYRVAGERLQDFGLPDPAASTQSSNTLTLEHWLALGTSNTTADRSNIQTPTIQVSMETDRASNQSPGTMRSPSDPASLANSMESSSGRETNDPHPPANTTSKPSWLRKAFRPRSKKGDNKASQLSNSTYSSNEAPRSLSSRLRVPLNTAPADE